MAKYWRLPRLHNKPRNKTASNVYLRYIFIGFKFEPAQPRRVHPLIQENIWQLPSELSDAGWDEGAEWQRLTRWWTADIASRYWDSQCTSCTSAKTSPTRLPSNPLIQTGGSSFHVTRLFPLALGLLCSRATDVLASRPADKPVRSVMCLVKIIDISGSLSTCQCLSLSHSSGSTCYNEETQTDQTAYTSLQSQPVAE